jgi:hypothetical protein
MEWKLSEGLTFSKDELFPGELFQRTSGLQLTISHLACK